MCRHCGDDTCCGGCWSAFIACLKCLFCCGGNGNTDLPSSTIRTAKSVHYKQLNSLPTLDKQLNGTRHSSEDDTQAFVTEEPTQVPGDKFPFPNSIDYNCWTWAENPVTSILREPLGEFPYCKTVYELCDKVKDKLHTMGCTCFQYDDNTISDVLSNISNDSTQFVIAMRTTKTDGETIRDYHFARFYYGQWTHKAGLQGKVQAVVDGKQASPPPEQIWQLHAKDRDNPRRIKFLRDAKTNEVIQIPYYVQPTLYLLVTLPKSQK